MKKITTLLAAFLVLAAYSLADTVTNRGQVITVNTLTNDPEGSTTITKDISKYATQDDREGLIVAEFDFSVDGTAVTTDTYALPLYGRGILPKGAILTGRAFMDVTTVITASFATNNVLSLGTYAVDADALFAGNTKLGASMDTANTVINMTPQAYRVPNAVQIAFYTATATNALTSGKCTVYVPYILGHYAE